MSPRKRDTVYQHPLDDLIDFEFDNQVVSVFEDMINRSVPGYATIVHNLQHLASRFVQNNSRCYDLGCSLGASTLSIRKGIGKKDAEIIAIDNSLDMITRAQGYIDSDASKTPVKLIHQDIRNINIDNASLVVLNFTLQFLPIEDRELLLKKIFSGLNKNGCLILSEKIKEPDPILNQTLTELHHQFKREQGYSELEIAQKREAIENIMKLESADIHTNRLAKLGFKHFTTWYQNTVFCSFIAIK